MLCICVSSCAVLFHQMVFSISAQTVFVYKLAMSSMDKEHVHFYLLLLLLFSLLIHLLKRNFITAPPWSTMDCSLPAAWTWNRRLLMALLLLLSTPLHQRAASRVQHPNHVAANSLSPQVARKGSTLSGFVQRSRLEREVGRDLHSNKWEEV